MGGCAVDDGIVANGEWVTTAIGPISTITTTMPATVPVTGSNPTMEITTTTDSYTPENTKRVVGKPAIGKEFNVPVDYDRWTMIEFMYDTQLSGDN